MRPPAKVADLTMHPPAKEAGIERLDEVQSIRDLENLRAPPAKSAGAWTPPSTTRSVSKKIILPAQGMPSSLTCGAYVHDHGLPQSSLVER